MASDFGGSAMTRGSAMDKLQMKLEDLGSDRFIQRR